MTYSMIAIDSQTVYYNDKVCYTLLCLNSKGRLTLKLFSDINKLVKMNITSDNCQFYCK